MTDSETNSDDQSEPNSDSTAETTAEESTTAQTVSDPAKVVGEFANSSGGATGVYGRNSATSGTTRGVKGVVDADEKDAAGVLGEAAATPSSKRTRGIKGITRSDEGYGVYGVADSDSGSNVGVFGTTLSSEGYGVYGVAESVSGVTYGLFGQTLSSEGYGVFSDGQLAVERDVAYDGNFRRHVATIKNTSGDPNGDVLGLRTEVTNPGSNMNYISFTDPNGQIGRIEGDGGGSVNYQSGSADLAEYFPTADPDASFDAGNVVGLDGGELVADPTAGDEALVVSDAPMVTGNAPLNEDDDGLACVALLGQVPVRVGASVEAGDLLVATPEGTAVPTTDQNDQAPVVGRALETGEADGTAETFVTPRVREAAAARIRTLEQRLASRNDRIQELEAENETLRQRVAAIEAQLGLDGTSGQHSPADD